MCTLIRVAILIIISKYLPLVKKQICKLNKFETSLQKNCKEASRQKDASPTDKITKRENLRIFFANIERSTKKYTNSYLHHFDSKYTEISIRYQDRQQNQQLPIKIPPSCSKFRDFCLMLMQPQLP